MIIFVIYLLLRDTGNQMWLSQPRRTSLPALSLCFFIVTPQFTSPGYDSFLYAEVMWRNPRSELLRFFDSRHSGSYRIYNLTCEVLAAVAPAFTTLSQCICIAAGSSVRPPRVSRPKPTIPVHGPQRALPRHDGRLLRGCTRIPCRIRQPRHRHPLQGPPRGVFMCTGCVVFVCILSSQT